MAENNGTGRGGKRPGAGRKRDDPWYSEALFAIRTGDPQLWKRAERMRAEAEAREDLVGKSDLALNLTPEPVAGQGAQDFEVAPPVSASARARNAAKQKAYRIRKATGVEIATIPYIPHEVINALLETGRITASDALDRAKVHFAIAGVVADFGHRWK